MSEIPMKDAAPPKPIDGFDEKSRVIIPRVIPSPVKVFTSNMGRTRVPSLMWEPPEWDLAETGRILDVEGYVRRAFKNKKNLFLKEGYEFVGANPDRVRYIKKRIQQMEMATNMSFPILMSQTVASLIRCHNSFWVKVRNDKSSGGQVRKSPEGKTLKPVAGYFIAAPETMRFKRDEYGKLAGYRQEIWGKEPIEFDPEDVVHFYWDKREGWSVGTPALVSVKDDIRALRRIEENVELLVYQHLFPLFHYKVGTEQNPAKEYEDGVSEVDIVQSRIAQMPSDGCWVTSERHEVTAIGSQGSVPAIDKIIAHFKQRIFTCLGQSSVDMGEGGTANRSTAMTMSRNLVDDTKSDQEEFSAQFNLHIIKELLQESTFDQSTLFDEDNLVELVFEEIDLEARFAKENHYVDIFAKNAITHDEMRLELGYKPFEGEGWQTQSMHTGVGDWGKTYYGLIDRDRVILQSMDEAGTPGTQAEQKSRTTAPRAGGINIAKATAPASGGKAVANKSTPTNQHGVRLSPKLNKDSLDNEVFRPLDQILKQDLPFTKLFDMLRDDLSTHVLLKGFSKNQLANLVGIGFDSAKQELINLCQRSYRLGLNASGTDFVNTRNYNDDVRIEGHVMKYTDKLRNELIETVDRNALNVIEAKTENNSILQVVMDAFEWRFDLLDQNEILRAYHYGKAVGFRSQGIAFEVVDTNITTVCEECKRATLKGSSSDVIIYEELPPIHPNCVCTIIKRS